MRKALFLTCLLLVANSAFAAIQYEFVQRSQSEIEQIRPTDLTGRAIIDGVRSRVDFTGGTQPPYPPGSYVISLDGSRTLRWVDPLTKSYTETNAAAMASSIGGRNIRIENLTHNVQKMPDQTVIAGQPTDHYHMTITYDMTVMYGNMPLKQTVREEIDKWTTLVFGDVTETFLAGGGIRTGNPQVDQLIDLETTAIKGFPLQQTLRVTTSGGRGAAPGSELAKVFNPTRTQSREFTVTSVKAVKLDEAQFAVPVTYKKVEQQQLDKNKPTDVTILSFDPGTK